MFDIMQKNYGRYIRVDMILAFLELTFLLGKKHVQLKAVI